MNKPHTSLFARLAAACAALAALAMPAAMGQNAMNTPFSQFGIGSSEQPFNMPMVSRMGGVAYTTSTSNSVNPFNPASYGAVESESFVFDMGVSLQGSLLRNNEESLFDADGTLGYLLVAMPLTGWWKLAGGLMPYTTVDYESVHTGTDPTYPGTVRTVYDGTGGVNQAFVGMAFNVLRGTEHRPDVQVGFNVNWLTGRIDRAISYAFNGNDSTYYLNKRRYKQTTVSNLMPDFGLQARQQLGGGYSLGLGVVYKPGLDSHVKDMAIVYTYHPSDESLVDTIFPARGGDSEFESSIERASTLGAGLSLTREKQWTLAFDATFAQWQGMKYTEGREPSIFGSSSLRYGAYSNYALGFERKGDMDGDSYWRRITWSLGTHYTRGALRLEIDGAGQRIDEWGLGCGVSLPMRKGRSLLTVSASYSSLGKASLLRRDVFTLGIAVSSCERWFVKKKYN
ncbi:MAG: hypothetical protein IJ760_01510 [Bacteroidales bacterium]|nr:hypothetical protein [Bacteroidales bacterium]